MTDLLTPAELAQANARENPAEYMAGHLAAKGAATDALAQLLPPGTGIDPLELETLDASSGAPVCAVHGRLAAILAAVAGARFFQRETFDARSLADQAVGMLRYAQKLAIAQNRPVYVRLDGKSVAACFTAACDTPASRVVPPAGGNSGGKYTLQYCAGQSNWLCVGRPDALKLSSGAAGFFFDPLGRPYYTAFGDFAAALALAVGGGGQQYTILVEAETGYVHR